MSVCVSMSMSVRVCIRQYDLLCVRLSVYIYVCVCACVRVCVSLTLLCVRMSVFYQCRIGLEEIVLPWQQYAGTI